MVAVCLALFKSQTAVNLVTAVVAFAVGIVIRFFMTPYVVGHLGVEAYGFVGLSANILGLTSLLTVALNSLAGRFIAIEYQSGNNESARSYYSSLFVSNIALGVVIGIVCFVLCLFLDSIVHIPGALVLEVKILFSILSANTVLALISGVWGVGMFVRNRIEVSNGISIGGNIVNAFTLLALFYLGTAHIWYVGVAILSMGVFVALGNFGTIRHMTPDIRLDLRLFDWSRVVALVKSGSWNLVSKLGELLGQGLDLLVANLFVGAAMTGVLAITKNIPFVLLGLFSAIAGAFGPMLVRRYAEGSHSQFMAVLNRAISVSGIVAAPIFACLFAFGFDFYRLWMPGQDAAMLQTLTVLGALNMTLAMPLEVLWTAFVAVNRLKWPTLFMLGNNILVFATMVAGCFFLERVEHRLMVIAGARSMWGIVRSLTFLPIYGAAAVCVPRDAFYAPMLKNFIVFALSIAAGLILRNWMNVSSWTLLGVGCLLVSLFSFAVGAVFWLWRKVRRHLPILRGDKPMIHFVYRMDMMNAGDKASCPRRYFHWPLHAMEHDIDDMDLRWFRASDVVVLGGGGLFDCSEKWNHNINCILEKCDRVVSWGTGFNSHGGELPKEMIKFNRFSILTIRDRGYPLGYEWLPCVSCMEIDDSHVGRKGAGVGVVSHRDHLIGGSGGDVILNSEASTRILTFILKHANIVTNSYHAAYWAGLLRRNIVLKGAEYSEKFKWLVPIELEVAKNKNRAFYRRVIDLMSS